MSAQISKDCTRPLVMSKDETKEKLAELFGLNKCTMQDIKARIDDYGSPLPHKAAHKPRLTTRHCKVKWGGDGAMVWGCFWGGSFRPLEIIDTSSVDQETYTNTLINSPDLNPIEHVWNTLERQIERKRLLVKNLEQLKVALQEEWVSLDDEFADRLGRSMKKRCEAVIKAKDGVTEY
ncbi:hypothetical protein G6F42_013597 [Rhizopus arrhizus]|nr:hypothetical protein G6F42_013597 [Rhizopus arrhizus]